MSDREVAMLSLMRAKASRAALTLSVAVSVLVGPVGGGGALAALDSNLENSNANGAEKQSTDDFNNRMRDLDKQTRDLMNTPVDFCDPAALDAQTKAYGHLHFQKLQLEGQREKIHPNIALAVKTAANAFADEGELVKDLPYVAEYRDALERHDEVAQGMLLKKMTPAAQAQAASERKDFISELKILTPLADSGDVQAQADVAGLYAWGKLLDDKKITLPPPAKRPPSDEALAYKYYQMAAANGDEVSQEGVARAYACGFGTERNLIKAYAWFSLEIAQSALTLGTDYKPQEIFRMRDFITTEMSHEDIQRAKHLTIRCYKSGYKDCD
jgi:hypothetical protein